jgi:hypothetical protein
MREPLSPSEVVKFFEKHPTKQFRLRQLMTELGLRSSQARELKSALRRLAGAKKIIHLKENQFVLAKQFKDHDARGTPFGAPLANSRAPRGETL